MKNNLIKIFSNILENTDKLRTIYNSRGSETQNKKLAEESAELIKELLKGTQNSIEEELSDVFVVASQLLLTELKADTIVATMNEKIDRELLRIKNEND